MSKINKPEVWLRGPLPLIPPSLQPVAHALLQAQEELNELMKDFPAALLWKNLQVQLLLVFTCSIWLAY